MKRAVLVSVAITMLATLVAAAGAQDNGTGYEPLETPPDTAAPRAPETGESGRPAPYPDLNEGEVLVETEGEARVDASGSGEVTLDTTAGSCTYTTHGDYPHLSYQDVSAHGWWEKMPWSGWCPTRANVDVVLQQWWCDYWFGCRWITIASGSKDVREGGGSGRWANARADCDTNQYTGFRSVIDVDLIGVSDPADKVYVTRNVWCRHL